MLIKTAYTSLRVSELENSKRFYTDVLGFEHIVDTVNENYYFSLLQIGDSVLELLESRTMLYEFENPNVIDHIAFSVENLEKITKKLESKKIIKLIESSKLIIANELIFIIGPDEERIELLQAIDVHKTGL